MSQSVGKMAHTFSPTEKARTHLGSLCNSSVGSLIHLLIYQRRSRLQSLQKKVHVTHIDAPRINASISRAKMPRTNAQTFHKDRRSTANNQPPHTLPTRFKYSSSISSASSSRMIFSALKRSYRTLQRFERWKEQCQSGS